MTQRLEDTLEQQQLATPSLLGKISEYCKRHAEQGKEHAVRDFYRYSVDVSSGWLYYTFTYGLQEILAGKDIQTILKTRMLGILVHAAVMRPVGRLRNYIAKKKHVTQKSSLLARMGVNAFATVPVQAIAYAGMLIGGMALSGKYDWETSAISWGMGMALSVPHSLIYGPFQDLYRRFFGVTSAIQKIESPSPSLEAYVEKI